jgi:hypothetical protein
MTNSGPAGAPKTGVEPGEGETDADQRDEY